jgi:hypothetical protein
MEVRKTADCISLAVVQELVVCRPDGGHGTHSRLAAISRRATIVSGECT